MQRLFDYDTWANREEVARLRALTPAPPRALAILSHIVATEWLWLSRLHNRPSPMAVWPSLTLDECASEIETLAAAWRDEVDHEARVTYTNSAGETWTNRARDILQHVILHGAYHRGQIAMVVRDGGETPAYTDFIHCVRQGFLGE